MNPINLILECLPEDGSSILMTDDLKNLFIRAIEMAETIENVDEYTLDRLLTYLKDNNIINKSRLENESLNVTILARRI